MRGILLSSVSGNAGMIGPKKVSSVTNCKVKLNSLQSCRWASCVHPGPIVRQNILADGVNRFIISEIFLRRSSGVRLFIEPNTIATSNFSSVTKSCNWILISARSLIASIPIRFLTSGFNQLLPHPMSMTRSVSDIFLATLAPAYCQRIVCLARHCQSSER